MDNIELFILVSVKDVMFLASAQWKNELKDGHHGPSKPLRIIKIPMKAEEFSNFFGGFPQVLKACFWGLYMDVISKNRGWYFKNPSPKWMVYFMENPMNKWDDLGGKPTPIFWVDTHINEISWQNCWAMSLLESLPSPQANQAMEKIEFLCGSQIELELDVDWSSNLHL